LRSRYRRYLRGSVTFSVVLIADLPAGLTVIVTLTLIDFLTFASARFVA
jgi:hypothetical protein